MLFSRPYGYVLLFLICFLTVSTSVKGQSHDDFSEKSTLEKHIASAQELMEKGSFPEALELLLSTLEETKKSENTSLLASNYHHIAYLYEKWGVADRAIKFYQKELSLISGKPKTDLTIRLSGLLFEHEQYHNCTEILEQLNPEDIDQVSHAKQSLILNSLAKGYLKQELYDRSLSTFIELKELVKHDPLEQNRVLSNIGYLQLKKGYNEEASKTYHEIISLANQGIIQLEDEDQATILTNLAIAEQSLGNHEKANQFLQKALPLQKEDHVELAKTHLFIAKSFQFLELHNDVKKHCLTAIELAKEVKDAESLKSGHLILADSYKTRFNYKKAAEHYEMASIISARIHEHYIQKQRKEVQALKTVNSTELEVKSMLVEKSLDKLKMEKLAIVAEKSKNEIENLQKERKLRQLEITNTRLKNKSAQHEIDLLKQQEATQAQKYTIELLENEKLLTQAQQQAQVAEAEKQENAIAILEQEKKLQEYELSKSNSQITISLLVIVLVLISIGFLIRYNRRINKDKQRLNDTNRQIEEQSNLLKDMVEELTLAQDLLMQKNELITDSINYAKRIQEAILPNQASIENFFADSLVYYRPKDIVSGDYYWLRKDDNKLRIAAADCTGHGVPGAFMSIITHNLLDQVASAHTSDHPAVILDEVNRLLPSKIQSVQQASLGNRLTDGMDIALCEIDVQSYQLQFAGAHNPAYIIRENELIILSGDRIHIGMDDKYKGRSFSHQSFQLQSGDYLYIFSDGYCDQIGGEKKKRFRAKRFQELLLSIKDLPMAKQSLALEQTFDSYRGSLDQLDDILIIGLKIK